MKIKKPKFKIKVFTSTPKKVASRRIVYKKKFRRRQRLVYLSF